MNDFADVVFATRDLTPETEFHAAHIYFGKGAFKHRPAKDRVAVLAELGRILNAFGDVRRVYAAIDTSKLHDPARAPEFAFAHFCERVQLLAGDAGATLLIGDLDDQQSRQMIRDFAAYRARGTPWDFGIPITSIVDAVHFARSHHSRLIQLADAYLFLLTHGWGSRKGWMADELTLAINGVELWGHRYKTWPP